MTVSTAPTPLSYSTTGSPASYAITWKYNAKSHVVVTLRSAAGVETVWALTTNYTLTDPGDSGTLTPVVIPDTGQTLVITLEPPNTQSSDLPLGGAFPSATVEDGLDLSAQRDAKIESLFLRALRVPKTDTITGSDLELPIDTDRASMFLAFDANGAPIASVGTSANLGPVSSFIDTLLDDTTAAAARTTLGAVGLTGDESIAGAKTFTGVLDATGGMTIDGGNVWSPGDVKLSIRAAADTGWILMNDGTVGNASSGASTRANADTEDMFGQVWDNITNAYCPIYDSAGAVSTRGASAAADYAANKRIRLPRTVGRAMAGAGSTGAYSSTFTSTVANPGVMTVDSNLSLYTGATVQVASTTTLPTGLSAATDYYVIRTNATTLSLATSLANAHAGTGINITGAGSGTHTMTMSLSTRTLGQHVGEEIHSTTLAENGPHTHVEQTYTGASSGVTAGGVSVQGSGNTGSSGSGTPHNTMEPTTFLNVMMKL